MKRALSYLLLVAYSTVMLMPVLPYVSDSIAHTFWLYQHIATVHYEHGKYHTHYEAQTIAKKTNTDATNNNGKYNTNADEHVAVDTAYCITQPTIALQHFCTYTALNYQAHLQSDYPPPKA
jgi:hypothetical protein